MSVKMNTSNNKINYESNFKHKNIVLCTPKPAIL